MMRALLIVSVLAGLMSLTAAGFGSQRVDIPEGDVFVDFTAPVGGATVCTIEKVSSGGPTFKVVGVSVKNAAGEYVPIPEALYAVNPTQAQNDPVTVTFANTQAAGTQLKFKIHLSGPGSVDFAVTSHP